MPITILNHILRSARDTSGSLLSAHGLKRCKSECFRNLQTDQKSQEEENDAALENSSSLWQSLTGRDEGWRLFGSEQAQCVLDYYRKRWMPKEPEQPSVKSAMDDAINADSLTAGKSLYSQWASRSGRYQLDGPNNPDRAEARKPLKAMKDFVVSASHDPFRHQAERMMSTATRAKDAGEPIKQRNLDRLKRRSSAPMFWVMDKSPFDSLCNKELEATASKQEHKNPSRKNRRARPKTSRISRLHSDDQYEREEDEDDETVTGKRSHHEKAKPEEDQVRPKTAAMIFSPDDLPLFDVNNLKKKYSFGGRLTTRNSND